jgi:phage tail tape-measure protein
MKGTYGLASAAPRAPGFGPGLSGMADQEQTSAFGMARAAAVNENNLNLAKKQHERERKAGYAQLASSVGSLAGGAIAGAQWGTAAGPWGALAGAVIGGLIGGAF